jgi:hypothetical protein
MRMMSAREARVFGKKRHRRHMRIMTLGLAVALVLLVVAVRKHELIPFLIGWPLAFVTWFGGRAWCRRQRC